MKNNCVACRSGLVRLNSNTCRNHEINNNTWMRHVGNVAALARGRVYDGWVSLGHVFPLSLARALLIRERAHVSLWLYGFCLHLMSLWLFRSPPTLCLSLPLSRSLLPAVRSPIGHAVIGIKSCAPVCASVWVLARGARPTTPHHTSNDRMPNTDAKRAHVIEATRQCASTTTTTMPGQRAVRCKRECMRMRPWLFEVSFVLEIVTKKKLL